MGEIKSWISAIRKNGGERERERERERETEE